MIEPSAPSYNHNARIQSLKREVEQLYQANKQTFGNLTATSAVQLNGNGAVHNTSSPAAQSGAKFETEVYEMKRQLWLNSCRGSDNHFVALSATSEPTDTNSKQANSIWNRARTQSMGSSYSYGRAFVAPTATDCLRELGRHHSVNNNINQRFGNTDDMKNLLEDIYDI